MPPNQQSKSGAQGGNPNERRPVEENQYPAGVDPNRGMNDQRSQHPNIDPNAQANMQRQGMHPS
jgi:hypothetical protein